MFLFWKCDDQFGQPMFDSLKLLVMSFFDILISFVHFPGILLSVSICSSVIVSSFYRKL